MVPWFQRLQQSDTITSCLALNLSHVDVTFNVCKARVFVTATSSLPPIKSDLSQNGSIQIWLVQTAVELHGMRKIPKVSMLGSKHLYILHLCSKYSLLDMHLSNEPTFNSMIQCNPHHFYILIIFSMLWLVYFGISLTMDWNRNWEWISFLGDLIP